MTYSRLDNFDPCFVQSVLNIRSQLIRNLLGVAAKRWFVIMAIVGMPSG